MDLSLDNLKVNLNAINNLFPPAKEPEKIPDPPVTSYGKELDCPFEEIQQIEPYQRKTQGFTGTQGSTGYRGITGTQGTGLRGYSELFQPIVKTNKDYIEKTIETSDGFIVRTRVGRIQPYSSSPSRLRPRPGFWVSE
jgi:hypothetical protein